jgi:hypothetical protein
LPIDTRPVELTTVKQIPESMPTEHRPGQTQSEALAEVDPTNFDPVCIEIQAGYKFCGDLKKKISAFSNLITQRPQAYAKLCVEEQKKTPVVTPEITAAQEVLNEWYTEGQQNSHVDDMSVIMKEYYQELNNLGNDIENIKKYNIVFTKTTRAVFKVQQSMLAKLKAQKKMLKDEMAAKEEAL